ncbi:hypothetical protein LPJ56_001188, partial [Coemansia sp. RSA 2599]
PTDSTVSSPSLPPAEMSRPTELSPASPAERDIIGDRARETRINTSQPLWTITLPPIVKTNVESVITYLDGLLRQGVICAERATQDAATLLPDEWEKEFKAFKAYRNNDWEGFKKYLRVCCGARKQRVHLTIDSQIRKIAQEPHDYDDHIGQLNRMLLLLTEHETKSEQDKMLTFIVRLLPGMRADYLKLMPRYNDFESFAEMVIADIENNSDLNEKATDCAKQLGAVSAATVVENEVLRKQLEDLTKEFEVLSLRVSQQENQTAVSKPTTTRTPFCVYCCARDHSKGNCAVLTEDLRCNKVDLTPEVFSWEEEADVFAGKRFREAEAAALDKRLRTDDRGVPIVQPARPRMVQQQTVAVEVSTNPEGAITREMSMETAQEADSRFRDQGTMTNKRVRMPAAYRNMSVAEREFDAAALKSIMEQVIVPVPMKMLLGTSISARIAVNELTAHRRVPVEQEQTAAVVEALPPAEAKEPTLSD